MLKTTVQESFPTEVNDLKCGLSLRKNSKLLPFRPFWDKDCSLLRVGGSSYAPVIVDGKHQVTRHDACRTAIFAESTISHHWSSANCSINYTRMYNLHVVRNGPAVDYAGPFTIEFGHVRKPTVVKAVHCYPPGTCVWFSLYCSETRLSQSIVECSNFVGAKNELREFYDFLSSNIVISCKDLSQGSVPTGDLYPESLVESGVKSVKTNRFSCKTYVRRIRRSVLTMTRWPFDVFDVFAWFSDILQSTQTLASLSKLSATILGTMEYDVILLKDTNKEWSPWKSPYRRPVTNPVDWLSLSVTLIELKYLLICVRHRYVWLTSLNCSLSCSDVTSYNEKKWEKIWFTTMLVQSAHTSRPRLLALFESFWQCSNNCIQQISIQQIQHTAN